MDVVPVIDVRHGVAVHAMKGARESYRTLTTPLASGSDPAAVAAGLLAFFPFPALYVADLDGIEDRARNGDLVRRLHSTLPRVPIWIDSGAAELRDLEADLAHPGIAAVIGSESLASVAALREICEAAPDRMILSLDFRDGTFVGPCGLIDQPALWPGRVIVMSLARVGSGDGPDIERVAEIAQLAPTSRVYAAGGVRDRCDLEALSAAGAAGALIATALHAKTISAGDLLEITGRSRS